MPQLTATASAKVCSFVFLVRIKRAISSTVSGVATCQSAADCYKDISSTISTDSSVSSLFDSTKDVLATSTATASAYGHAIVGENIATLSASSNGAAAKYALLETIYDTVVAAVYPDVVSDIPGTIPFLWQYNQRVLVSEFADGSESRRASWAAPRKDTIISYHYITRDEAQRIYDFYQGREGPLQEFAFFFPNVQSYEREYCGTYTGATTSINLPSKLQSSGSYRKLYNGSTEVTNYSFYYHGAPDGGDRAVLGSAPAIGDKFYFSFAGRLKIRARFSESPIQVSEIKDRFSSFAVELIGLDARFV